MLNVDAVRVAADGQAVGAVSNVEIFNFANRAAIYSGWVQQGVDSILRGMLVTPAQRHDLQMVEGLRSIDPQVDLGAIGDLNDLMATHVERGRDRGVPDHTEIRRALGLPAPTSFAEITSDPQVQVKLAALYGSVTEIDPLIGMLAEDRATGSIFGETAQALYQRQFQATRDGDRLWYQVHMDQSSQLRTAMRTVGLDFEEKAGVWTLNRTLAGLILDTTSIGAGADVVQLDDESEALFTQ